MDALEPFRYCCAVAVAPWRMYVVDIYSRKQVCAVFEVAVLADIFLTIQFGFGLALESCWDSTALQLFTAQN